MQYVHNFKVHVIFLIYFAIFSYKNALAQHPNFPTIFPLSGALSTYDGTLKFKTGGPFIEDPYEAKTGAWVSDYEDFHFILDNDIQNDFMNYRLLRPKNYDPNRIEPYPLMIMQHGAGESGRAWDGHYSYTPDDDAYDNNGRVLIHGGYQLWYAVREGKHPKRTTASWTNEWSFDGFVIFPQSHYGGVWNEAISIRLGGLVDDMVGVYNIDPNRVYTHGLSNGAVGTLEFVQTRPDLIAALAPMSGAGPVSFPENTAHIPTFMINGGLDRNPSPGFVGGTIELLESHGADFVELPEGYKNEVNEDPYDEEGELFKSRHWFIPNDAHGIWYETYDRRDFFSWFLSKSKKDIFIVGGDTVFCPNTNINSELRLSPGFTDYRWFKDDVELIDENSWKIVADDFGIYKVMYSRKQNPDPQVLSDWDTSNTLEITSFDGGIPPVLSSIASNHLPSHVGTQNISVLRAPTGSNSYQWFRDGSLIQGETNDELFVLEQGSYSVKIEVQGGCYSNQSLPIYIRTSNDLGSPATPSNLISNIISESDVQLDWTDESSDEIGFEIYVGESTSGPFDLKVITVSDVETYICKNLLPGRNYYFYIRAINSFGTSDYTYCIKNTLEDLIAPEVPGNVQIEGATHNEITLSWDASIDNFEIDDYDVFVNNVLTLSTASLGVTLQGLSESTIYLINIRAKDKSGNLSPLSPQLNAITKEYIGAGLNYKFYYTSTLSTVDDIESLSVINQGVVSNFDISQYLSTRNYNFAYSFEGYIDINQTGTYTFETNSDDGSKLFINGTELVDNDGDHGGQSAYGSIDLGVGVHEIKVLFYEDGGGESLNVYYDHSSFGRVLIPDKVLVRYDEGSLPSLPGIPTGLSGIPNANMYNQLSWNDQSDDQGFEVYRSEASGGSYIIIGAVDEDVTTYSDFSINPSTSYYYVLKAKNAGGLSDFSSEIGIQSTSSPIIPSAPTTLTFEIENENPSIELNWIDNSSNETFFNLERSAEDESNYVTIARLGANSTSYIDLNFGAHVNYYYRVSAENAGGVSNYSNIITVMSPSNSVFVSVTSFSTNNEGGIWNNFSFVSSSENLDDVGSKISNLGNNFNDNTTIDIEVEESFDGWGSSEVTSNAIFPINVMTRYHSVNNGNISKLKISGLDHGVPYNFFMMASISVSWGNWDTKFKIGSQITTLDGQYNADQLAVLNEIVPNENGEIILEISANSGGKGILNALVIERSDPTNFTDYFVKADADASKLYNWGIYSDGTGGVLKSFAEDNKNLHINGNVYLVSNLTIDGSGTRAIVDGNATVNVYNDVNVLEFTEMEVTASSQVSFINLADTCNIKLTNGDLTLGDNSILNIGANTLTVGENNQLNSSNSTGAISINNGNIIINSRDGSNSYLNLVSGNDNVASLIVDLGVGGELFLNNELNLTDNLKLYSGQVNTSGNLVLVSDEGIDASILKIEDGASIVGDVEYQRYWKRDIGTYGFYYIGSPIQGQAIADWIGEFHIQGVGTSSWKNLRVYDESTSSWVGIGSDTEEIVPGKGINSFMFSSNFTDEYIRYDNIGHVEQGEFSFDVTYTVPQTDPGWNLVANPYPCAIDWSSLETVSGIVRNNVDAAMYVWNQSEGRYNIWAGGVGDSPIIASGQGFFIRANGDNPILTVNESIKVSDVSEKGTFLREGEEKSILQIVTTDAASHVDKAYISLMESATEGFDSHLDAYKLKGSYMNLSSVLNGEQLAINALPRGKNSYIIPLAFEAATGTYSFTFNNLSSFNEDYIIILKDAYTEEIKTMTEGLVYEFSVDGVPESFGVSRFSIEINGSQPMLTIAGQVKDVYAQVMSNVSIVAASENDLESVSANSDELGTFEMELRSQNNYTLEIKKSEMYSFDEVNLKDYLVFNWYVRGRKVRLSDWEYLAADMDLSGQIDKQDLKIFRDVFIKQFFRKPQSFDWRFVSENYLLERNGKAYELDAGLSILYDEYTEKDVVLTGIIPGDVYAKTRHGLREDLSDQEHIVFTLGNPIKKAGVNHIPVYGRNFKDITGFQFSFDANVVGISAEDLHVNSGDISSLNSTQNILVWAAPTESPVTLNDGSLLFYLELKSHDEEMTISEGLVSNESGHGINGSLQAIDLSIEDLSQFGGSGNAYLGVYPNPYNRQFKIRLKIEQPESAKFSFYDTNGKLIHTTNKDLSIGLYELDAERDLGFHGIMPKGILIMNIQLNNVIITDKLIRN